MNENAKSSVSIELSKSTWLVAVRSPSSRRVKVRQVRRGDTAARAARTLLGDVALRRVALKDCYEELSSSMRSSTVSGATSFFSSASPSTPSTEAPSVRAIASVIAMSRVVSCSFRRLT